jgi:hypothetical protein
MPRFRSRVTVVPCAFAALLATACHDPQPLSVVAPTPGAGAVTPAAARGLAARVEHGDVVLTNDGAFPVRVRLTDARELPAADAPACGAECPVVFPGQTVRIATSTVRGFSASTIEVAVTWWAFAADGVTRRPGEAAQAVVPVIAE